METSSARKARLGNLIQVSQAVWRESYTYDMRGNRAGKTTPWGTITYGYDAENRLIMGSRNSVGVVEERNIDEILGLRNPDNTIRAGSTGGSAGRANEPVNSVQNSGKKNH
jgi:YD repeat-containing protein